MKRCSRCWNEYAAHEFLPHPKLKDGLGSWCRLCRTDSNAAWVERNREHVRAYQRDYMRERRNAIRAVKRATDPGG